MRYTTLCENHLFRRAYQGGKSSSLSLVAVCTLSDKKAALLARRNPKKEKINRVGISATPKVGKANQRNRAKRLIREAYRQIENEYPLKKGKIIVISARTKIVGAKCQDVKAELLKCFSNLDLFFDKPSCEAAQKSINKPYQQE